MTLNFLGTCLHASECSGYYRTEAVRGTPDARAAPPATARVLSAFCQPSLFQQGVVGTFAQVHDDLVRRDLDHARRVDELPEQSGRARPDETLESFGQPAVEQVRQDRQCQIEVHVQPHVAAQAIEVKERDLFPEVVLHVVPARVRRCSKISFPH